MLDDGPTDDFVATTTFQGLAPSGATCLLDMLVMGVGMCNTLATFTRLMARVLSSFIHLFLCIYAKSAEDYLDHLGKVLTALRENKLFIKTVKCFWAKR
jgi:hypothetical protein